MVGDYFYPKKILPALKVSEHSCYAMGTRFLMILPGIDESFAGVLGSEVNMILQHEEQRMSRFRNNSELGIINRYGFGSGVSVSAEMKLILQTCHTFYLKTAGAFNPVIFNSDDKSLAISGNADYPSNESLPGFDDVLIDEDRVRICRKGLALDLGGFGKGWAMEKVLACLRINGITSAFVSFGESLISMVGNHPMGNPWQMDIPGLIEGQTLNLKLSDESISLSGLKSKRLNQQVVKVPHIIQSSTGKFVTHDILTLARSELPLKAEILSTALMAADNSQKTAILQTFPDDEFFEFREIGWSRLKMETLQT